MGSRGLIPLPAGWFTHLRCRTVWKSCGDFSMTSELVTGSVPGRSVCGHALVMGVPHTFHERPVRGRLHVRDTTEIERVIYFIQDQDSLHVKIGFTSSDTPEGRLKAFQTGNSSRMVVLATMAGEMSDEQELHARFCEYKVAGEWFRPCLGIINLVAQAKAQAIPKMWPPKWLQANDRAAPLTFYLAGKISKKDWRDTIVTQRETTNAALDVTEIDQWVIQNFAIWGRHHYAGPFFMTGDHYQSCHGDDGHGTRAQQSIYGGDPHCSDGDEQRAKVRDLCLEAIGRANVVYAWIDSLDCYGTIVELGYARALQKEIWIAGPRRFRDMWFVYELATFVDDEATDALSGFQSCIGNVARKHIPV